MNQNAQAPFNTKHEAQAVIDALAEVNAALDRARKAGWIVAVTMHSQSPDIAQNGPFRELRATITREV